MLGRPDAGKQQHLRRVDGAAAKDHFPTDPHLPRLALVHVGHAHAAAVLKEQLRHVGLGDGREVFARQGRVQVAPGGAAPQPIFLRYLVETETGLLTVVEIVVRGVTGLGGGFHKCLA